MTSLIESGIRDHILTEIHPNIFFKEAMGGFSEFFEEPNVFLEGVGSALAEKPAIFQEALVRDYFTQMNHEANFRARRNPGKKEFNPVEAISKKQGSELVLNFAYSQGVGKEIEAQHNDFSAGRMVVVHLRQMQSPNQAYSR